MKNNLENAGSIDKAYETFLRTKDASAFVAWCDEPCMRDMPDWVELNQWFTDDAAEEYYKIVSFTNTTAVTSSEDNFLLDYFATPGMQYYPVQIRPWTLAQAELAMLRQFPILIDDQTVTIVKVSRCGGANPVIVVTSEGDLYTAEYLAKNGETAANEPCGIALPLYQRERPCKN